MEDFISIGGRKITLTAEQSAQLREQYLGKPVELASLPAGSTFIVGQHEMVVLEQNSGMTAAIRKELLRESMQFGSSNNFCRSKVDNACMEFADELFEAVGRDNLVLHTVDLTSDDGLKDYAAVDRYVSLLTADQYRKWVKVLDLHKLDAWWWLATPYSTARHENDRWVKCVAPSGGIDSDGYDYGNFGVRPFCIFKSSIFVSC